MKWVRPKTPPRKTSGLIEIHSDDGWLGDWSHWMPTMINTAKKHSDWLKNVPFNPAINTANIDKTNYMSWEHIAHIVRCGGEVHSHGRYHISIGALTLAQPISAGDTKVVLTNNRFSAGNNIGLSYDVYDNNGSISETFEFTDWNGSTMFTEMPLTKNHNAGVKVQLSEASTIANLQGAIDDLANRGIDCTSHTYTWGDLDDTAKERVSNLFDSARRSPGGFGYTHKHNVDMYDLSTNPIEYFFTNDELDKSKVDNLLNEVSTEDSFAIIRGHGDKGQAFLDTLEYIVEQSMLKGIKLVTRNEAIEFLQKHNEYSEARKPILT